MSRIIGYLTIDRKGRTTFPQEMRKQLGITPGVQLRIEQADNGTFELVPTEGPVFFVDVVPHDQINKYGRRFGYVVWGARA